MGISLIPELKGLAAPAAPMSRHRLLDVTGLHVMVEIVGEEATIVIKTKGLGLSGPSGRRDAHVYLLAKIMAQED